MLPCQLGRLIVCFSSHAHGRGGVAAYLEHVLTRCHMHARQIPIRLVADTMPPTLAPSPLGIGNPACIMGDTKPHISQVEHMLANGGPAGLQICPVPGSLPPLLCPGQRRIDAPPFQLDFELCMHKLHCQVENLAKHEVGSERQPRLNRVHPRRLSTCALHHVVAGFRHDLASDLDPCCTCHALTSTCSSARARSLHPL